MKGWFEGIWKSSERDGIPYAFQVHRSDLHNMLLFLALEDPISTTTGHADYVEELGSVDHVVVYELVVSRA